ncbi:hypothetical protein HDV04_005948 [Boothiomyces sp. JEL0838]|nr:hypothetical protein HDV04_005948 [Boothiomyces sp. JEL0838]
MSSTSNSTDLLLNDVTANICIGLSAFILFAYAVWIMFHLLNHRTTTMAGWHFYVRRAWVKATKSKKNGSDILAVQSLRNWIIVCTFLATTVLTIAFAAITMIIQSSNITTDATDPYIAELVYSPNVYYKIALCLTQAIRYFNHVAFAIGIQVDSEMRFNLGDDTRETTEHIAAMLNFGTRYFTMGIRGIFFSMPIVFWYFSPIGMLISSIIIVSVLMVSDSTRGLVTPKEYVEMRSLAQSRHSLNVSAANMVELR